MRRERSSIEMLRAGHAAAAMRTREILRAEGARPEQAVAEALAALNALADMQLWPGPRDAVSERAVEEVRARWSRIERRARASRRR